MENNEFHDYEDFITRCRYCSGDKETYKAIARSNDPYKEQCLACERLFAKGILFLNNVG